MKKILIPLLVACVAACTEPAVDTFGNIGGTVSDADTGNPLSSVTVQLTPTGYSQVTGASGTFQFDNLDVQEYTLTFKRSGYQTYQHKVTVKPGLSSSVQVSLQLADVSLPVIAMQAADNVSSTSFILHAQLQSIGTSAVTDCGFCYATHANPKLSDNGVSQGGANNPKSLQKKVEGLTPETKYYCRAYAQNDAGLVYSDEIEVTTAKSGSGSGGTAVTSGMVLYYTFDNGDAKDATVMEIDGQAIGTPTFPDDDTPSGQGKSIFLNGSKNQYVNIPYNLFKGYKNYSISVWLKDFSTGNIISGIGTSGNASSYGNFPRLHYTADGKMAFQTTSGYYDYIDNYSFPYPCTSLQSGVWHHIVVTCSNTQQKLYVDGVLSDSMSQMWLDAGDNCPKVEIGGDGDGKFPVFFSGKLDNVRIYSRELSVQDVKDIYNAEK